MIWLRKLFLGTAYFLLFCALLSFTGCSSKASMESKKNKKDKVEVATIGLSQSQNRSFAESYTYASKFFDAHKRGMELNKESKYAEAIEVLNQSLSFADNRAKKAMAYSGLAASYAGLGDTNSQIEYMEKEAKATLNENQRTELLKQVEDLRAQHIPDAVREGRVRGEE